MLDAKIVDLKMNVAKTQLNRKNKNNKAEQIQVKIDGAELKKQYSVRYLGVHIDKDLTWKVHVNHLRRTCLARLAMIRRAGHHLPCHVCKLLCPTKSGLLLCSVELLWSGVEQQNS